MHVCGRIIRLLTTQINLRSLCLGPATSSSNDPQSSVAYLTELDQLFAFLRA